MSHYQRLLLAAALCFVPGSAVVADPVPVSVANFSFEAQNANPPGWLFTIPSGWSTTAPISPTPKVGLQTHAITGMSNSWPAESAQQAFLDHYPTDPATPFHLTSNALGDAILANSNYVLTVALGNRALYPATAEALNPDKRVHAPFQYTLALLVNDVVKASSVIDGAYDSTHGNFIPEKGWRDFSLSLSSFDDPSIVGSQLKIRLSHQGGWHDFTGAAGFPQAQEPWYFSHGVFDNVRLTVEAIPEPSSVLLMSLSLLGAAAIRRRRRNDA